MLLHSALSCLSCIGALPSPVPMIEFVCFADEKIFNDCYPFLGDVRQWECSPGFFVSDAKDRANERGKELCDADFRGIVLRAVLGPAAEYDTRILTAIAMYPPEACMARFGTSRPTM